MPAQPPKTINALVVGGGGREHALAWKLRQSPRLGELWLTHPQNPGLARLGEAIDVPLDVDRPFHLQRFCENHRVNLVVIGPEAPLAAGLADGLRASRRAVVGPDAEGARLEADKAWAKQMLRAAAIPTAEARIFTDPDSAKEFLQSRETAHVVKAAGLAGGKGVIVPDSLEQAIDAVDRLMNRRAFGDAGERIVIEERLTGPEASVMALVDGRSIYVLEACQDHKRLLEGDRGPNTGGMGAYCPTPVIDDAMMARIERSILVPAVDALRREGIHYQGVLYAGLMLTHAGPKVLEFNVRFGDPECQALLARLRGDFAEIMWRTGAGGLAEAEIDWDPRAACCVVLASEGYPDSPRKGVPITGVEQAEAMDGVTIFHAGTSADRSGRLTTAGGRVLNVVALGESLDEARRRANEAAEIIQFEGKHFRRDIGAVADHAAAS